MQIIKKNIKKYKEILNLIKKYDTIVVYRHQSPDFDAAGTQNGLVTWLKDSFPNKKVYSLGKNFIDFVPQLYPANDEVDVTTLQKFLTIVCDTGNTPRIDGDTYKLGDKIVKFDHHPDVDQYADVSIVNDELASCAELVLDFVTYFKKKYPLSLLAAKYFYSGIVGDSGRFMFGSTSSHTFEAAVECIKTGLNFSRDVYRPMYEKTVNDLNVQKYLLNNYKVSEHGVAYYALSDEQLKEIGIRCEQAKIHMSMFSNIKGIEIWVAVAENVEEGEWRVSIRSKGIAINGIAAKYGGGGHDQASGAKLKSIEELDSLIKDLDDLLIK